MLKRDREDGLEGNEGLSNGIKIQKVAQSTERALEDSQGALSQDLSGSLSARKNNKQQSAGPLKASADIKQEVYKDGKRFKIDSLTAADRENNKLVVRIPVDFLQRHNRQVKARQLWGVDLYTHDSDLVAILMHCGYINSAMGISRDAVQEARVVVEYLPAAAAYPSCYRNGIRSRAWGTYTEGCSLKILECVLVTRAGAEEELQAHPDGMGLVVPTFTPVQFERVMSTRASASSVERRLRALQEVSMQYNLCNEPWLKYSMQFIADRGLKPSQLTSSRLLKEVLFLESARNRYQICHEDGGVVGEQQHDIKMVETYRFARCKRALPLAYMRKVGIPIPQEELETISLGISWDEFKWGPTGLNFKGQQYQIIRLHFTQICPPGGEHAEPSKPTATDTTAAPA